MVPFDRSFVDHPGSDGVGVERTVVRLQRLSAGQTPERARAIRTLERRATGERQSQVFIEAPYRNAKLLGQLLEVCAPDTRLTLAVDITSPQEYIRTLTVREWRSALLPEMDKRPAIFILADASAGWYIFWTIEEWKIK